MATATKTVKGFAVTCPLCGDEEGSVKISLTDIRTVSCGNCGEDFTVKQAVEKVARQLDQWRAIERWVGMAGEALSGASEDET